METKNTSGTYRWAITTLVGLLCFSLGVIIQGERLNTQVTTNTIEIRILKESLRDIGAKLDVALAERK